MRALLQEISQLYYRPHRTMLPRASTSEAIKDLIRRRIGKYFRKITVYLTSSQPQTNSISKDNNNSNWRMLRRLLRSPRKHPVVSLPNNTYSGRTPRQPEEVRRRHPRTISSTVTTAVTRKRVRPLPGTTSLALLKSCDTSLAILLSLGP